MKSKATEVGGVFEIEGAAVEVTIKGSHVPGVRGLRTLPNGDPGYPDEPAETEVEDVTRDDTGESVLSKLTKEQVEEAETLLADEADLRERGRDDAAVDYAYEQMKDDEIFGHD